MGDITVTLTQAQPIDVELQGAVVNELYIPSDGKVLIDSSDTTSGYLASKTQAGTGISLTIVNPAGNEKLQINNTAPDQTVAFTGGTNVTIGGTYPNFTLTDNSASSANLIAHTSNTSNPHSVTKSQVGLGNVLNVDTTNPANITQDSTHRFVTDTEKSTWNGKQDALGFTPENVANKSTDTSLGTSNSLYPTQNAVKVYVDAHAGGSPGGSANSIQYNNNGAFGGFGSWNGTDATLPNIIDSGLTVNQAVMTNGSKRLISADYLNQSVKTNASPTFLGITVGPSQTIGNASNLNGSFIYASAPNGFIDATAEFIYLANVDNPLGELTYEQTSGSYSNQDYNTYYEYKITPFKTTSGIKNYGLYLSTSITVEAPADSYGFNIGFTETQPEWEGYLVTLHITDDNGKDEWYYRNISGSDGFTDNGTGWTSGQFGLPEYYTPGPRDHIYDFYNYNTLGATKVYSDPFNVSVTSADQGIPDTPTSPSASESVDAGGAFTEEGATFTYHIYGYRLNPVDGTSKIFSSYAEASFTDGNDSNTYNGSVSWDDMSMDGYVIFVQDNYSTRGWNFDHYQEVDGSTFSITDDNTGWTEGDEGAITAGQRFSYAVKLTYNSGGYGVGRKIMVNDGYWTGDGGIYPTSSPFIDYYNVGWSLMNVTQPPNFTDGTSRFSIAARVWARKLIAGTNLFSMNYQENSITEENPEEHENQYWAASWTYTLPAGSNGARAQVGGRDPDSGDITWDRWGDVGTSFIDGDYSVNWIDGDPVVTPNHIDSPLQVTSNKRTALNGAIPANSTDTGAKGEFVFDDNYLYIANDTNSWRRVSLSSF